MASPSAMSGHGPSELECLTLCEQEVETNFQKVTMADCEKSSSESTYIAKVAVDSRTRSRAMEAPEDECCSISDSDLMSVSSFNSLSSRSSSENGDSTSQDTCPLDPTKCFESMLEGEDQASFQHALKSTGKAAVSSRSDALEAKVNYQEKEVFPRHWSKRQMDLASQGPMKCNAVTLSELLWWTGVRSRSLFLIFLIFSAQYYVSAGLILPALLLPRQYAALVYCAYAMAYSRVLFRRPERAISSSGKKSSPGFQEWFGSLMEEASVMHFGNFRIIRDTAEPFDPQEKYIFGYHPHGMLPAVLAWFPFTQAWRDLLGTIHPVGLVATAIFKVPVIRDLCLGAGIREVSRATFVRTLEKKGAVLMCPGGQAEIASHMHSSKKQVVLSARKTGFIGIALDAGAKLVPIFSFGESQLLDNLFNLPSAQKFTYKVLGFPVPFVPIGLFGVLPIPKTGPVTLVVGQPLDPREYISSGETREEGLERMRVAYYQHIEVLFEKHKERLGFGAWQLVIQGKC